MDTSRHPSADRATPMETPASAGDRVIPNLPALITALPGDQTRAPQTEFDRSRQVAFLENLSVTGSVRSAAAAAQVSHQTAYRARRATPALRTAWDAALVVARANAADVLACRAIDGVEEKVYYHGEEIATRTRYSDRLLLAHLARLDTLAETPAAGAFAEDWDAALVRFEAGAEHPEKIPPEPCNTRSKSYSDDWDDEDWDDEDWDDDEDWTEEDEQAAEEAEIERIQVAMHLARPKGEPCLYGRFSDDHDGAIEAAQYTAFEEGVERWWAVVPPVPWKGDGAWHYIEERKAAKTGKRKSGTAAAPAH